MPVSNTEMQVTWTDNSNNEDEFRIEREEVGGGAPSPEAAPPAAQVYDMAGTVDPDVTTFHDTNLEGGKTYHYGVTGCNQNGCSEPSALSEDVATYPELVITTAALPGGVIGTAYNVALAATGGDGMFGWSSIGGPLPAGLMLSDVGTISGIPTELGQFNVKLEVEGGGQKVTADLMITITAPPPTGVIAFSTDTDGDGSDDEVMIINPDGTGRTPLSANAAKDDEPTFSGDGTKIAFRSDRDGNANIYVQNADGMAQMGLTVDPAHDDEPNFSPDGTKIVFYSTRSGGDSDLFVINADGTGGLTQLTFNNGVSDDDADWSPDGMKIVFSSTRDGAREIYTMDADGMNVTRLTFFGSSDDKPSWSPDRERIVFESDRDGQDEIYSMKTDGTDLRRLTNHPADDEEAAWSKDGNWIVFDSDRDGFGDQLYIMPADGSEVTRLTQDMADNDDADWGP